MALRLWPMLLAFALAALVAALWRLSARWRAGHVDRALRPTRRRATDDSPSSGPTSEASRDRTGTSVDPAERADTLAPGGGWFGGGGASAGWSDSPSGGDGGGGGGGDGGGGGGGGGD